MDYLLRSGKEEAASPYSNIGEQYYEPSTSDVLSAFTQESYKGVGTGYADISALEAERAKKIGVPLTEEDYKTSPYYRSSLPYSRDLTTESAKVLAEYNDEREKNAFIINHASTAQTALGYATGFAAGVFEPKNIATGVAASAVLSPIVGGLAPTASSLKRIIQLKKALGRYGDKALIGGVEGMVAAAVAEPSNQYSAGILKQDYTMADTLWNVGLSATFGAGFNTVPGMIKEKWQARGAKAPDIAIAELDTATSQLSQGKRVDVSPVERSSIGEIAKKPPSEVAAAVERFVRYTETPEFKTRFEGSKVVDEAGAPLRVYHGTNKDFETFGNNRDVFFFTKSPESASTYATGIEGANIRPTYLNLDNPKIIDAQGKAFGEIEISGKAMSAEEIAKSYKKLFKDNDGVVIKNVRDDRSRNRTASPSDIYIAFSPEQIIPAFGADDMQAITRRVDAENRTAVNKAVLDDLNPDNDTAIDSNAARELDTFDNSLSEEEKAISENYKKSLEEISFMKKEGLMTDAEIEMFTDAINSINAKDIESAYDSLLTCLTRG